MAETQYWRGFLAISVNCSAIGEKPFAVPADAPKLSVVRTLTLHVVRLVTLMEGEDTKRNFTHPKDGGVWQLRA